MDLQIGWEILLLLFLVAALAGFIDTIAGGGGLITVPVLLSCGLPVINALATNKLQGSFGTFVATLTMARRQILNIRESWVPAVTSLIGSALGTALVYSINPSALDVIIPIVLIVIGLYFLLAPAAGKVERAPRLSNTAFNATVAPAIGFYDGFFGPGTGSFFSLANVALKGQQIIKATANAKFFNCTSNIASVVLYIAGGKVIWFIGLSMMLGQWLGAFYGSRVVLSHGTRFIRPMIVIMSLLLIVRYLYQKFY
ncbi:TSUP family transporter [Brackiella oedipodis]|uniref:TSUP family transporter n=1 Tax=Brackiella oedipodis TaxID=124225 RepID=UPI00048D9FD7|nr:TSUP family transporter [Brackiella oedipodis]